MKFMCICYYDAESFSKFKPADFQRMQEICGEWDPKLKASGKAKYIGALPMPNEYKTLRAKDKKVVLEEGPYAHTREPFGAFFILEASDMDEAVGIARLHPGTHLADLGGGGIEIRPISMFEEL